MPPYARRLLFALMAMLVATPMPSARAADWLDQAVTQGFFVCGLDNGAATAPTLYFSDVIADTGLAPSALATRFTDYVAANYKLAKRPATCAPYRTEAEARAAVKEQVARQGSKVVETGWKLGGSATPSGSLAASQPAKPKGKTKEDGLGSTSAERSIFCWTITPDYIVYMSKLADLPAAVISSRLSQQFDAFTAKTYGTTPGGRCQVTMPDEGNRLRQAEIDQLRKGSARVKFVEFDWSPTAEPTAAPAKPAAPTTAAPSAQDAYEKALAAQRPRSNTEATSPAKPATPSPAPAAATSTAPARPAGAAASANLYAYCYANSTQRPSSGPVQQHFYVTPIFPVAPDANVSEAFQNFMRSEYPTENVGRPSCTNGIPQNNADAARRGMLAGRRGTPNVTVTELTWKP